MREILAAIEPRETRAPSWPSIFTRIACAARPARCWRCSGGLDALVFTGGVGEHCAPLRERLCAQLGFLGLRLDTYKNGQARADMEISSADSSVRVLVIGADEELEMARECARLAPGLTGTRGASSASK